MIQLTCLIPDGNAATAVKRCNAVAAQLQADGVPAFTVEAWYEGGKVGEVERMTRKAGSRKPIDLEKLFREVLARAQQAG